MCCRIRRGRSNVADDVEESWFIKAERRKEVSGSCEEGVSEEGEGVVVGVARSTEGEEEVDDEVAEEAGEVGVRVIVVVVVDIGVVVVGYIH